MFLFSSLIYVLYTAFKQFKSILVKQKTNYRLSSIPIGGDIDNSWPISPNGNLFNNWLMIVYSLPIGFYLHSIYSNDNKRSQT